LAGRQNEPIAGSGLPLGTYVLDVQLTQDMRVYEFEAWATIAASVSLRRFTRSGNTFTQVGSSVAVSLASGLNTIGVSINASAGEYLGIYAPSGTLNFTSTTTDNVGYYATASDSAGFTGALNSSNRIEARFKLRAQTVTSEVIASVHSAVSDIAIRADEANLAVLDFATSQPTVVEGYTGTLSFGTGAFGGWAGVLLLDGVTTGTQIRYLGLDGVRVATGATKVRLSIYSRLDGGTAAPPADCTLIFEADYTLAEIGLVAGSASPVSILLGFDTPYIKGAGDHLAWRIDARDDADAKIAIGMGYLSDASATASQRGWFYASLATATYSNLSSPSRLSGSALRARFVLDGADGGAGFPLLGEVSADVVVEGSEIVINGLRSPSTGDAVEFNATLTPTLAATGQERMDLIVLDRATQSLSLVAGASRTEQLDALEWQAATPTNSILIGRARVTDDNVQAVSVAGWRGLIRIGAEAQYAAHIERNRAILRRLIGRAARAATIRLGGYGDSITSIQGSTPTFAANGTMRDRGLTYLTFYPSDTRDTLTLYDTGDGAGLVHTRLGWNWDIKAALDAMAGSEVVTYLNYGIGSTNSQATASNGLDPARIAVPLADDLDAVVIGFGMNERGQTYTYANILNMIGQFQAVNTDCIVMGCPRPNGNQSLSAWRITNAALEAAALDGGAAYVSTQDMSDDTTLGGIGVPASALCSANTLAGGNNHPGIFELRKYGEAAVLQLGL